jgi:hypothetical protein
MSESQCDDVMSRALALTAFPDRREALNELGLPEGIAISMRQVKAVSRPDAQSTLAKYYQSCEAQSSNSVIDCVRDARNVDEMARCSRAAADALAASKLLRKYVLRRPQGEECTKYIDKGIQLGALKLENIQALVRTCPQEWIENGMFECRMSAATKARWNECED